MRVKSSIINAIVSIVAQVVTIVVTFISRRIFLQTLGESVLGINSLFNQIISMMSLMELGIGSAIIYSLYYPLATGKKEQIAAIVSLYKKIYTVIGVMVLVVGSALTPFITFFITGDYSEISNIYLIFMLFVINSALTYFNSYKQNLIVADQKKYITVIFHNGLFVLLNIVQIFVLLRTINSISVAWFGINLFANATADSMNKGVKSAEKMKKALAGFDEMNVLQDTSTSGAGGRANLSPSVDLSQVDEKTVEKTKNFWKDIFKFWEEDWEYFFTNVEGNWGSFIGGIVLTGKGFYDTFKGIFTLITGLFKVLVGIFLGDLDLMKQGWSQMGKGLVDILVGAMEIISGVLITALGFIKGIFLDLVNGIWYIINNVIIEGVKTIGSKVGNVIASAFKVVVNGVLWAIENILNTPIRHINSLVGIINKILGINLSTLPTFKLPRLAVGGIVNMPGRGVPIGGAITGERGAEGVIPLTDSQAMETLGATIGRYITINANITNTMNGRVISREMKKINAENDFATNS